MWQRRLTFFNLLNVVLESVKSTTKWIVFKIQLEVRMNEDTVVCKIALHTMENPVNTSLAKAEILSGASKSPSVTAFTARRDLSEL